METPTDVALFKVMKYCLKETVTKRIGYEAKLAQMKYSIYSIEDMSIRVKISGYSDKILIFVKEFLEIMRECAKQGGFEKI